jgi:hypothetical protein
MLGIISLKFHCTLFSFNSSNQHPVVSAMHMTNELDIYPYKIGWSVKLSSISDWPNGIMLSVFWMMAC